MEVIQLQQCKCVFDRGINMHSVDEQNKYF